MSDSKLSTTLNSPTPCAICKLRMHFIQQSFEPHIHTRTLSSACLHSGAVECFFTQMHFHNLSHLCRTVSVAFLGHGGKIPNNSYTRNDGISSDKTTTTTTTSNREKKPQTQRFGCGSTASRLFCRAVHCVCNPKTTLRLTKGRYVAAPTTIKTTTALKKHTHTHTHAQ